MILFFHATDRTTYILMVAKPVRDKEYFVTA